MSALKPFLHHMRLHWKWIALAMLIGLITLVAAIGLLSLSGWFITATALAGAASIGASGFNFFTPGAGVRGFAILRTAARYGERIVSHEATFRVLAEVRLWLYRHLAPLGPAQLTKIGSGELLSRLMGDIEALDNLYLRVLSPTVIALVGLLILTGFLALFSPVIALVALVGLLLSGVVIPAVMYFMGRRDGQDIIGSQAQLRAELVDLIQGMPDLRIYGGVQQAYERADTHQNTLLQAQQNMGTLAAQNAALMTMVSGLTLLTVLVVGVQQIEQGALTALTLSMLFFTVMASFELVAPLPLAYQYLGKTIAAAKRLVEVSAQQADISYPAESEQKVTAQGAISFQNVDFAYVAGEPVIRDLNLKIAAGEKVAVVGHSGSGKSSLIHLLARFGDVSKGCLNLGGADVRTLSEADLRGQCSVMAQPVHLFAGTVAENLRLANAQATDEQLLALLDATGLAVQLGDSPLQYQVGEAGNKLSGGQRKRIGVIRALLRKAPILLLDEPTEGLDRDTESDVLNAVLAQAKADQQTLLWITHHLQFIERFDRVVVLEEGRLIEEGDPVVLLKDASSALSRLRTLM